uniref:CST complex subunit CTC1 n=1 Tax=Electrophorus electricus TaxID=8005 RepID=A0A4W4EPI7_ELEEL
MREVHAAVRDRLHALAGASLDLSVEQLAEAVVWRVERTVGSSARALPVSHRCVSVSELLSRQRTPCFSSLTWSTNQYREWAREAEQALPNHRALARTSLLLIGFLCDGRSSGQCDGFWRVRDASGSVYCETLKSSPHWLGKLMLFPTWSYIPQDAPEPGKKAEGYLELIGSPVCVTPEPTAFDPGWTPSEVIGVKKAARLLRQSGGMCVCVGGEVSVVCPLLVIGGKRFFCFILVEEDRAVPVLVTRVYWRQCVDVAQCVCVSALRVCSLRGRAGHRVLSVTSQSHLRSYPRAREPDDTLSDTRTQSQSDTHSETHTSCTNKQTQSVSDSHSQSIGRITSVLNEEAGLYEIDGKVGLCLAYQPQRKWGGGALRPGAEIELHNVHFLFRPSLVCPDVVLCACLRSSISVMNFSPLTSKVMTLRSDNPLLCYLLERNLSVSEYLWLSYCYTAVMERLSPRWVCAARVCVVAGRVLQCVLQHDEKRQEKRDIYREMLQDPHTCPLTQYRVNSPSVALCSVRELCDWMESESWACLSLSSLLPSSAPYLTRVELNPLLSWSAHMTTLRGRSQPALLVGVVQVSSSRATLRLVDQTAAVDCVCVEATQAGGQHTAINTAWIGCLVCVRQCTLVMERFLKTDFPSWKHLDQPKYITHRHCRYTHTCIHNIHTHYYSAYSNFTHLSGEEDRPRDLGHHGNDPRAAESSSVPCDPCVSLLFRLDAKHGVAFRNVQTSSEAQGLTLSFVAKATCLGNAQRWDGDPRNRRVEEREMGGATELQFVDLCVRWFPLLQSGSVYRLTALHTQDVSVLSGSSVPVRGGVTLLSSPSLLMQPEWRIHNTHTPAHTGSNHGLVASSCHSCASDIVSFYGVISKRITLQEEKDASVELDLRVRLTVQDAEAPDRSVQVYLDLSRTPYIPALLPGATVQLLHFQRRVVRNVYCWSLPIICLMSVKPHPPPPLVHLGVWTLAKAEQSIVGQITVHVVCVLFLRLQWVCSFCGSVFRQATCTRSCPPCDSTSAVFQAEAKVAVEDGTGEAQVWFSTETVAKLLLLAVPEWEGLQRHIRSKGHLRVYARARSMVCDTNPDDPVVQYLCCLCSSSTVCRQVTLTCKLRSHKPEKAQLRNMCRGDREFITKFPHPLQLKCTDLHTHTHSTQ